MYCTVSRIWLALSLLAVASCGHSSSTTKKTDSIVTTTLLAGINAPDTAIPLVTAPTDSVSSGETVVYVVAAGDTLMGISTGHCISLSELVAINGWTDGSEHAIFPGTEVAVPEGTCARTPDPTTPSTVAANATPSAPSATTGSAVHYLPYGDPSNYNAIYATEPCTAVQLSLERWEGGPDVFLGDDAIRANVLAKVDSLRTAILGLPDVPASIRTALDGLAEHEGSVAIAYASIVKASFDVPESKWDELESLVSLDSEDHAQVREFVDANCPIVGHDDS